MYKKPFIMIIISKLWSSEKEREH